ncbi:MAG: prepilin-type N-terminal cleavage/methylation domain-containing protein, partial [Thermoguttaceae bacterium]|nr:prepilin-type N-terminal cleavage/methylation domain-containing protein [Thermoguttaceae bacterium]
MKISSSRHGMTLMEIMMSVMIL